MSVFVYMKIKMITTKVTNLLELCMVVIENKNNETFAAQTNFSTLEIEVPKLM